MFSKEEMAQIAADMVKDGQTLNLGIGLPTLVANFLENRSIMIHSENGLLGMGPYPSENEVDPQIINAGKETVTIKNGGSTFDSTLSFGMIRGNHIDVAILGGMEVSVNGDLANWQIPGQKITGMGGAMDLATGAKQVIVMMNHHDKSKRAKLVKECTLPLTALSVVDKVITELGVFLIDKQKGKFIIHTLAANVQSKDFDLDIFSF